MHEGVHIKCLWFDAKTKLCRHPARIWLFFFKPTCLRVFDPFITCQDQHDLPTKVEEAKPVQVNFE